MLFTLGTAAMAVALLFASSGIASADDLAAQLVGVWKLNTSERKFVDGETVKLLGDKPQGTAVLTKGGTMVLAIQAGDRKAAAGQPPTDAELAALCRTAFFATGTYKVEGDKGLVVIRYTASSTPFFIAFESRSTFSVTGSSLTWIGPKEEKGRAYHNHFTFNRLE